MNNSTCPIMLARVFHMITPLALSPVGLFHTIEPLVLDALKLFEEVLIKRSL